MSEKTHKIIRLETENVKRIQAVSVQADGNMVEITGKNKAGKSSLLDSIWMALGGVKDAPPMPIRKGAKKAKTVITTDNGLIITRTFNAQEDGSYTSAVIVETTDGMRAAKPQDLLNKLVGELAFDPFAFVDMKPADQFDILKRFVPDFDFKAEAEKRKEAFTARTDVNRRIRDLKAQADGITVPEETPDEEISVSALVDEIQQINEENAAIERRKENRRTVSAQAQRFEDDAEAAQTMANEFRRRADEEDKKAKGFHDQAADLRKKLEEAEELPEPRDTAEIRTKMTEAESTNTLVRRKVQKTQILAQVTAAEAKAKELTAAVDASDERKMKAISEAKIPVEGIGFGDEQVLLDGVPFEQASTAEKLGAAVQLTMAMAPRFRVILVRDASLLDEDSWAIMEKLATEHDFQLWIETVRSDNPAAIVIEDGMVKGSAKPAETPAE